MGRKEISMNCPICGNEFKPKRGQLRAYYAVSWCDMDSGLLCPTCHKAAEELGTVFKDEPAMCQVKWKSDIAKASAATSPDQQKKTRADESLYKWLGEHGEETPRKIPPKQKYKLVVTCDIESETLSNLEDIADDIHARVTNALIGKRGVLNSGDAIMDMKTTLSEVLG
jgi:rubredoxin